jgi:hypothetical protein
MNYVMRSTSWEKIKEPNRLFFLTCFHLYFRYHENIHNAGSANILLVKFDATKVLHTMEIQTTWPITCLVYDLSGAEATASCPCR